LEEVQITMRVFKIVKLYRIKILRGHHICDTYSGWVTDGQTDIQTSSCTDIKEVTWVHTYKYTRAMQAFYVKENFSRKLIILLHSSLLTWFCGAFVVGWWTVGLATYARSLWQTATCLCLLQYRTSIMCSFSFSWTTSWRVDSVTTTSQLIRPRLSHVCGVWFDL